MKKILLAAIIIIIALLNCKRKSAENAPYTKLEPSQFIGLENIDLKDFPNLSVPIFGVERPLDIPDTENKDIIFEEFSSSLYLMNFDEPKEKINITLKDPKNNIFKKELINDKEKIFNTFSEDVISGMKYRKPVIYIPFLNYSFLNSGDWEITVAIDNNENTKLTKKINVVNKDMTILPKELSNPIEKNDSLNIFSAGSTAYIYGKRKETNSEIYLAIYQMSDELNDKKENILRPYMAVKIKTDPEGKFKTQYKIGTQMPKGQYDIATGTNSNNLQLHLFTGIIQVQ